MEHIADFVCRSSTLLCRIWWNSCQTSSGSSTRSYLIPSRLSKCPRSCPRTFLCERLFAMRSWWKSWWKCRRTLVMQLPSLPRKPVGGGQQRHCLSSSLTLQLLIVEVLVIWVALEVLAWRGLRQARAVLKYWPGTIVDVPSIVQLVFQQSKSYVFFAAIQSLERVLDIPIEPQKGDSTAQSLNKVVDAVVYESCPWS